MRFALLGSIDFWVQARARQRSPIGRPPAHSSDSSRLCFCCFSPHESRAERQPAGDSRRPPYPRRRHLRRCRRLRGQSDPRCSQTWSVSVGEPWNRICNGGAGSCSRSVPSHAFLGRIARKRFLLPLFVISSTARQRLVTDAD
jgi:hypothetical protein